MDPVTILLAVFKFLGFDGAKKLSFGIFKWTVRLFFLAVFVIGLCTEIGRRVEAALAGAWLLAWLLWKGFQRLRRPQNIAGPVERTIDGKTVPDKLAVAAVVVPEQSAGIYDVLRGLPDYGKTLLKLDAQEFAYRPEEPERKPEPEPEPVKKAAAAPKAVPWLRVARVNAMIWLATVPRGAKVGSAAAVLLLGLVGVAVYQNGPRTVAANAASYRAEAQQQQVDALLNSLGSDKAAVPSSPTETLPAPAPAVAPRETPVSDAPLTPAQAPQKPTQQDDLLRSQDAQLAQIEARIKAQKPVPPMREEIRLDPGTGQKWTFRDNGHYAIRSFPEARSYCESLHTGALTGWRLPSSSELMKVLRNSVSDNFQLDQPAEAFWTSTPAADGTYNRAVLGTLPAGADSFEYSRVLCVHD